MEKDVKQRVMDLIDIKADSVYSFAKQINVAQTTISEYLNNGKKVSFTIIRAILDTYPDVSAEWLLRGKGDTCYIDEQPKDGDSDKQLADRAELTRLRTENEELKKMIIELRAVNEYQEKRLDKMIAILHQEPPYNIAADNETSYNK